MPIQVLPPQLANQIAAGEVVERPASVVKELVENSLDAGATRIDIEIERGGARLIRIRDNGGGIGKDELALALARHATSKISTLDDLEAIMSLGFRGEALASISSVSRLTLTSRTRDQNEAWQAYAEGRDMAVSVKPAAHPVGTTVEVLDLFYNTPARRKFLRTEKTEFTHIDEVIRRIALARFDVALNLHHNGKLVRQYRAVAEGAAKERRLGAICGSPFLQHALALEWEHGELAIRGWVADPRAAGQPPDMQYSYVNGRMMRDKLITHAIRQAYQDLLSADQQPAYVLYLQVDPHQVDVNVHPAKHEVRFHQARLVHDFIYQAVLTVLQQASKPALPIGDGQETPVWEPENRAAAGVNQFNRQPSGQSAARESEPGYGASPGRASSGQRAAGFTPPVREGERYQKREGELYQRLMKTEPSPTPPPAVREPVVSRNEPLPGFGDTSFGRVLMIHAGRFALVEHPRGVALLALDVAERCLREAQLTPGEEGLRPQPLLIPVKLTLNGPELLGAQQQAAILQQLGIEIQLDRQRATLRAVPLPLRQQNLPQLVPAFLAYLGTEENANTARAAHWLAGQLNAESEDWTVARAIQLLADVERLCPDRVKSPPPSLLAMVDLNSVLKLLKSDTI